MTLTIQRLKSWKNVLLEHQKQGYYSITPTYNQCMDGTSRGQNSPVSLQATGAWSAWVTAEQGHAWTQPLQPEGPKDHENWEFLSHQVKLEWEIKITFPPFDIIKQLSGLGINWVLRIQDVDLQVLTLTVSLKPAVCPITKVILITDAWEHLLYWPTGAVES